MAEKENKDTKKETTSKKTTNKEAVKKETAKKEPVKKQETKKDNKEIKTTKTTNKSTKKEKEEPKKEVKKVENKAETAKVEVKEAKKVEAPKGKVTVETKKFEIKNNKKASKKGSGKKVAGIIVVIAVIAIVALLTVLIVTSSDPKKSVDGYLTNLKAGDFEKAQEFTTGGIILADNNYSEEVQKLLFDKISWKVTKVSTNNDSATVEIEVTNKDFSEVVQNCMKKMLSNFKAVLGGTLTTQDIGKYFEEELRNENLQTKTTTGTIKLEKQDKKWKIIVDEEIENVLLPDLESSINYIQ